MHGGHPVLSALNDLTGKEMSYINTALKKVQKEKEGRYQPYGDVIISSQKKARHSGKGLFFVVVVIAGGMVILGAAFLAYEYFGMAVKPARTVVSAKPPADVLMQRTAEKASVPPVDQARLAGAAEWYEKALAAQREKRWEEAEHFYQQALSLNPLHGQALNNLGVLSMSRHRYAEATELFIRALAAQDHYVDPYYNLACLYAQMSNTDASLGYLQKAVTLDGRARAWAKQDAEFAKMKLLPSFKKITDEMER